MKQKKRVWKYFWVGVTVTLTDYVLHELLILLVFKNVELEWLALMISGVVAMMVGFVLHNRITWKERNPGKWGPLKFIAWNSFVMFLLRPWLSSVFALFTGLYQFAFGICQWLHLPFSYDFVYSTGIYGLCICVTMILNFLVYERLIFKKTEEEKVLAKAEEAQEMRKGDFDYLGSEAYFDSACQSLRPQPVMKALETYYTEHNSCGERVKYKWGLETDRKVLATRKKVLKYLQLKQKDYFVSFTLNTTYGLNLLLNQIHPRYVNKIYTSEIEHNSVFLSTMAFADLHKIKREVLKRKEDGSFPLNVDFKKALVVVNCVGNFDGMQLKNIKALVKKVRSANGIVIIDAAQAMAHHPELLYKTEADAICFSAHKMYGPSLGGMIVRKDLIPQLRTTFIGGGMVDDVKKTSYLLSAEKNAEHIHTIFEPGLQAYGEIIALGEAIDWLKKLPKSVKKELEANSEKLFEFLKSRKKVHLINTEANPTISFYVEGVDSHLIGAALGDEGIMTRTGYFCAHYYLDHVKKYPPLVRVSMGYHTRAEDVEKIIKALDKVTK